MKIDVVKTVKIVGTVLGVAGTLATGWASSKENDETIKKLVEEKLSKSN